MTATRRPAAKGRQGELSERQRKAIELLASGLSHAAVAQAVPCAEHTLSDWKAHQPFAEALTETRRKQAAAAEEVRLENVRAEAKAYGSALRSVWTAFTAGAELVARDYEQRLKAAKKGAKGVAPKPSDLEALAQTIERMREIDLAKPVEEADLSDLPLSELVERSKQFLRVVDGGKAAESVDPKPDIQSTG